MATTLGDIITLVRERADLNSSQFFTDAELTRYINYSTSELWGLLVNSFGGNYFATNNTKTIPAGATQPTTDFPNDLYKFLGVDLQLSPYPSTNRITLQPYNFNERNRANAIDMSGYATQYATNYRYNIFDQTLLIQPPAGGNLELLLWYVPTAPQFSIQALDVTVASPNVASGILNFGGVQIFKVGQQVQKYSAGIPVGVPYYVINTTATTITLSLSQNGTAVNLTGVFSPAGGDFVWSQEPNLLQTFTNNATLNGWLEYVIVDVCIKCKGKEETDPTMFIRQKALLTERIRNESQNRDIGSPAVVSDVYAVGTVTDRGWGGGWGGSGGVW